ncbi:MAG: hypothetical protein AAF585_08310 [Verrucomicrobiota bacterium]
MTPMHLWKGFLTGLTAVASLALFVSCDQHKWEGEVDELYRGHGHGSHGDSDGHGDEHKEGDGHGAKGGHGSEKDHGDGHGGEKGEARGVFKPKDQ